MRVVIAGAGEVGYHVVGALYREGVDIAAIDSDPAILERLRHARIPPPQLFRAWRIA